MGLSEHEGRSSLALSFHDLGDKPATSEVEKKGEKKQRRDKFRTALQEAGRDQQKPFQMARSACVGCKPNLLARVRANALSVPSALLSVCSSPVCNEMGCILSVLSAQSSTHLQLKEYVSKN